MKSPQIHWLKKHLGKGFASLIYKSLGFMSDELFVKTVYRLRMGRSPDLENPKTFTEKLQYLKLHDHNPMYTQMADKIGMRSYVEEKVGKGHTLKLLGVWDGFDSIDFGTLPDSFVLKTNHDSGSYVICRGKNTFDREKARKVIEKSLRRNYYKLMREWQYKDIVPKVFAEEYIEDGKDFPTDYKMFCFNGEPRFMYMEEEAADNPVQLIVNMEGKAVPFSMEDRKSDIPIPSIPCFDEMKKIARKLSENVTFLRVDMYLVKDVVYVGELTFYHYGGYIPFNPPEWDGKLGDMLEIRL